MRYALLFVGIILLGFWLRITDLDRYPDGISRDETINVIDAFHISRSGIFPLYQDYGEPEPLYRLILIGTTPLFGSSVWAYRFVSALIGVLTLAVACRAAYECLGGHDLSKRQLAGLAAAAALSVAVGHIVFSRGLYRGILQPLMMLAWVLFLARAVCHYRIRDFALAGLFLGLIGHTYTAGLAILPSAAAPAAALLIFHRQHWRKWLRGFVWMGAAMLLVLSPLLIQLAVRPDAVLRRTASVAQDQGRELFPEIIAVVNSFFTAGDINPQYNAAQAPMLPPLFNILFLIGLVALIVRIRHPVSWLLGAMLVLCTVPVIAAHEIPHGLRGVGAFGVFPAIVGMAVGLLPIKRYRLIFLGGIVALTTINGAYAYRTYIDYWAQPGTWSMFAKDFGLTEWFFRPDRQAFGRWITAQQTPLLIPVGELADPATRTALILAYPRVETGGDQTPIPQNTLLVVPYSVEGQDLERDLRQYALLQDGVITLLPPFNPATHQALIENIDAAEAIPNNSTAIPILGRFRPIPANFAYGYETHHAIDPLSFSGETAVMGWRGADEVQPSQWFLYTLQWQSQRQLGHNYSAVIQILTQDYQRIAGAEAEIWRWFFPSTLWQRDQVVEFPLWLSLPDELQPGAYRLAASMYLWVDQPLLAYTATGESVGTLPTIGWLKVPQAAQPSIPDEAAPIDAVFAEGLMLRSAVLTPLDDGRLQVRLYWEGLVDRPPFDATIFIHMLDSDGTILAQSDSRPWNGQYPTFIWDAGEIVMTEHILEAMGEQLRIGMYTLPGVTRLTVTQDGEPLTDDVILLPVR